MSEENYPVVFADDVFGEDSSALSELIDLYIVAIVADSDAD